MSTPTNMIPRIEYQYASIFDLVLCMVNKAELDAGWVDEVNASINSWQADWNSKGSILLEAATILVGRGFNHQSYIASLYLFPRFPSMSHPLILQVTNWIKMGRDDGRPPLPETLRVSITFHEMLHIFITEVLGGRKSRFQTEYANETSKTRAHLLLNALLQSAYEKAGFADDLGMIRGFDCSYDGEVREYARAWDIVSERGVEPFLAELRLGP